MIAKTGKEGAAVILCDRCNVSQDVIAIKVKSGDVDPFYLATFLNTRFGAAEMRRWFQGQVQFHLSLPDTRVLSVPLVDDAVQRTVRRLVERAEDILAAGGAGYAEAEAELLDQMAWQRLSAQSGQLWYLERHRHTASAARCDAEYFQPWLHRLRRHLLQSGAKQVIEFCPAPERGVQPVFVEDGDVWVIDSKSVRPGASQPSPDEMTDRAFLADSRNAKAVLRFGDVLLNSTGRGTLGRATCWRSTDPAVADNHVTILRPNPQVCLPVYLALFLNSPAGVAQSEMFQTGSSGQLELSPSCVERLIVYLPADENGTLDLAWQQRLVDKVLAAVEAKAQANAELEKAKAVVEREIEKRLTGG